MRGTAVNLRYCVINLLAPVDKNREVTILVLGANLNMKRSVVNCFRRKKAYCHKTLTNQSISLNFSRCDVFHAFPLDAHIAYETVHLMMYKVVPQR